MGASSTSNNADSRAMASSAKKGMTSPDRVRAGHECVQTSGLALGRRGRGRFLLLFRSGGRFLAGQENLADADGGVRLTVAVAALVALAAAELLYDQLDRGVFHHFT